jgi:type I restriction enzyme S subunit
MLSNKAGAMKASSLPQVEMTTGCLPYDVLVSNIRPYFKKIIRVETTCGCSTDVLCFHPVDTKYMSYMYRVLYDDSFFAYVMAGSKGTKMPRGDKQQIMKYPIVIPTNFVLEKYSNLVEPMFELISSSNKEIIILSTLRDTLLPKLMSGQIKV